MIAEAHLGYRPHVRPVTSGDERLEALCSAIEANPKDFPDWWFEPDADASVPAAQTLTERLVDATFPSNRLTLTVEETAKIVNIGRTAAYEAVRRGDLPSKRLNGRIVVPVPALLAWLGADCPTPWA